LIGCFFAASSTSKFLGTLFKISSAMPLSISSWLRPPAPALAAPYKLRAVSRIAFALLIADVISALS